MMIPNPCTHRKLAIWYNLGRLISAELITKDLDRSSTTLLWMHTRIGLKFTHLRRRESRQPTQKV